jgi:hypothetical protein
MSKTIVDKLNMNKYGRKAVLHVPEGSDALAGLDGYDKELKGDKYDLIFAYVLDMPQLQQLVREVIDRQLLAGGGYLFAAYPKKGNKVYPTFIHRDDLFAGVGADADGYVGASSLKFARMVGLDDVFTVVGFKEEAKKAKARASSSSSPSPSPSQRVDDYIGMIPNVEQDLQDTPELLAFYRSLTPGYRKDWARYVYSGVQEETRAKRREEMKLIMSEGFKSAELYRASRR